MEDALKKKTPVSCVEYYNDMAPWTYGIQEKENSNVKPGLTMLTSSLQLSKSSQDKENSDLNSQSSPNFIRLFCFEMVSQ